MLFAKSIGLLALLGVQLVAAAPAPALAQKRYPLLPYTVSPKSASLQRLYTDASPSSRYLHARLTAQADLISEYFGLAFLTNITFGTEDFTVIIDTGSSDTWLAETGFTCVNITNNATVPQADCAFASTFTLDATFQQISDENFNISYADGEYLNGVMGYEDVTLAGILVKQQEVGLATLAGWEGDGISSGLVGLAYPAITSAFAGTNATADNFSTPNHLPYSSIINTIFFVENLTAPLFSLALSRDNSTEGFGGYMTIGGIPDTSDPKVNASSTFAMTDIQYLTTQFLDPGVPEFQFYTITIDDLLYGSYGPDSGEAHVQFIVDSGTTFNYVPSADAKTINSLYLPPAVLEDDGNYYVDCNAVAPALGVQISSEVFYHNPSDLIFDAGIGNNTCLSGVQDGGTLGAGTFILGDVFLKNVLAVFDMGNETMAFSSRQYYES